MFGSLLYISTSEQLLLTWLAGQKLLFCIFLVPYFLFGFILRQRRENMTPQKKKNIPMVAGGLAALLVMLQPRVQILPILINLIGKYKELSAKQKMLKLTQSLKLICYICWHTIQKFQEITKTNVD